MRQGEAWYPAQAVALMLPGHRGLHEIDLLVDQSQLHPGKSGGNHLVESSQIKGHNDWNRPSPYFETTSEACYLLQLLVESMYGSVRFRRAGHVHVQFIAVGQCIQTQNKRHIVVEQAGLWRRKIKQK